MALRLTVCLVPLIVSGCCFNHGSDPVPLKTALAVLERDLQETAPVALTDLDGTAPGGAEKIKEAIFLAQCLSKSPNPLVPVLNGPISVAVQGSISQAGGGTGTIGVTPSLALSYTVTQAQQQQLTVPLSFISARGLPNFYLGQNLANLNGLSDDEKKKFVEQLEASQGRLRAVVDEQINAFERQKAGCPKDPLIPVAFPQIQ